MWQGGHLLPPPSANLHLCSPFLLPPLMGAQGPPVQADLPNLSPGNPSNSHLLRSCLISNLQSHPPDCLCPFDISTNSRSLYLGKKKCAPGEGGNRTGSILKAGFHLGPDCGLWATVSAVCPVSMKTTYQLENQAHGRKSPRALHP